MQIYSSGGAKTSNRGAQPRETFPPLSRAVWRITDEVLANMPHEINRRWGERFGKMTLGLEATYRLFGPIEVFDSICRLATDRTIPRNSTAPARLW
jgi:hypothetical protein